ncbi:MAG: nucleotide exchange factor GrpE [Magnetococcales bacterium]|nr:nucleotide exchange factor GrpE [Magnetococcales bacterium]
MGKHKESNVMETSVATGDGDREESETEGGIPSAPVKSNAAPEVANGGKMGDEERQSPEERIKTLEEALAQEVERSEARRKEYLSTLADMDNQRKRNEREMEKARKFALTGFAKDLLTLADNVDRALTAIRANLTDGETYSPLLKSLIQGVEMMEKELSQTFVKHGIEKIKALNQPFDPNLHQAITQVDDTEAESGSVVQELQTGYLLNGRLLRPTLVNIAK